MFLATEFLLWHGLKKKHLDALAKNGTTLTRFKYQNDLLKVEDAISADLARVQTTGNCVEWFDNFSKFYGSNWAGFGRASYKDSNFTVFGLHQLPETVVPRLIFPDRAAEAAMPNLFDENLFADESQLPVIRRLRRAQINNGDSWYDESPGVKVPTKNGSVRAPSIEEDVDNEYETLNGIDSFRGEAVLDTNVGSNPGLTAAINHLLTYALLAYRFAFVVLDINLWNRLAKASV